MAFTNANPAGIGDGGLLEMIGFPARSFPAIAKLKSARKSFGPN
jgi:hypothetical protein